MFDAGALVFKLITVGKQAFNQDQAEAAAAVEKTGKASAESAAKVDKLGTSTDETGKKARKTKAAQDEQATSTKKVGDESEKADKKQKQQKVTTEQHAAATKELSTALLLAGTAAAAMVTLAVAKNTEFGAAMSNVRAATMSTASEQRALGEAALDAGADTAYSASEAAAAEEELAKAGQSVSQIIGGSLNGALALAAAGQLQVARSAEIMATTLTQFRLPAEQAAHVSDVLASGAGKAQGSVDDLALALSYVGPLAGSVGFSLNETAGTIAYFATQGIIGEKAGTSLRGVLASLQAPSAAAAAEMDRYSISMFDGNGNMLSMAGIAEQLRTRLRGLTEQERLAALGRIFGNESLNAATLLYEGGAAKVNEWTAAVDDSGFAARQASMRQDNLAGDIEKLGGAFDTALIRTGSAANDVLRGMTQSLTELVDMYGEAPEPIQVTAAVLGVATAAILLFAGGAVGARARFLELKTALDQTSVSMGKTAAIGGAVGLALTGVITIVGLLMAAQAEARQKAESYADALEQGADAVRGFAADNLVAEKSFLWINRGSAADAAEKLGVSLDTVADAATGNAKALEEVNAAIQKGLDENWKPAKDANFELAEAAAVLQENLNAEAEAYKNGTRQAAQKNEITEEGAEVSKTAADAYLDEADSVQDLNAQLRDLIDTIGAANGMNRDAVSANIDYQDSVREIDEQIRNVADGVEGFARGLDITTEAGAANKAMLVQLSQDAWDAAAAQLELDGDTAAFTATLEAQRQKLYDAAIQMGASEDEAAILRDTLLSMPDAKTIQVLAETSQAQSKIGALWDSLNSLAGSTWNIPVATEVVGQGTVLLPGHASGGPVVGPGTGTSDSIIRRLSNGEHIITAAEVQAAGGHRGVETWRQSLTRGGDVPVRTGQGESGSARSGAIPAGAASYSLGSAPTPAAGAPSALPPIQVIISQKGGIDLLQYIDIAVQQPTKQLGFEVGG
ncbi:phage tail tape measure protein [Microbacterium foliorum]